MKKIVVLKAEGDKVEIADFEDYKSIQNVVGGLMEHFYDTTIASPFEKYRLPAIMFCNEECLLRDDLKTVNALATALYGNPIYGDVAVLKDLGNGDDTGFDYKTLEPDGEETICECWMVEDYLTRLINNNKDTLEKLHKQYDDNKPEPFFMVTSMDDMEK